MKISQEKRVNLLNECIRQAKMAKRAHNSDELFELKWNNYSNSITEEIYNLRQNDLLVDLTFCCEGVTIGEFLYDFQSITTKI